MKNLFLVSILLLLFSCAGETKTDATEHPQANSDTENPQNSSEEGTRILAKNEITEEVKAEKIITEIPEINSESKSTTPSKSTTNKYTEVEAKLRATAKNEAEAKAQIEAEKAIALSEKMQLEEEMRKAESAKRLNEMTAENLRKEKELIAKAAQKAENAKRIKEATSQMAMHDDFNALLKKHVSSSGKVNYQGFKKEEVRLDAYLKVLEKTIIKKSWSRNKTLAFWINAYNANTIKLILKNYPVKSIMDLNNGKPWDVKWIKIDQRTLSLNNIENDIIRPKYKEPRIHFAVNCAAKSCPPLLNKAWTESNLNSNLERQTKSFINNSNYNTITSGKVEVSKIFDWYGKDFGDLKTYLNKYSSTKIGEGTSVNFKTYNWNLNN